MKRVRITKYLLAFWLSAAVVVGVSRQLYSTLHPVSAPEELKKHESVDWVERASAADMSPCPTLRCASAFIVDNKAGEIIYNRNAYQVRPIASITKLLTALVLLETGVDLSTTTEVTAEDAFESSRSSLRPGELYTLRDLLYASLVSSDNRAARALSRSGGMPQAKFIARMNDKARELGMDSTRVVEPTGLSELNIATARDCAILVNASLKNPLIRQITSSTDEIVQPLNRKRKLRLANTNRLLQAGDMTFMGAKTGFIRESGWCITARALSPDGDDVTAVVLGAPTANQRFVALENALHWAFDVVDSPVSQN